jgi:PA14 domain/Dolichyl-phosphate-mannose-protein mannosyltransferase
VSLDRRSWLLVGSVVWLVLAVLAAVGPRLSSPGLVATYFYGPGWSGSPRLVAIERPGADDWLRAIGTRFDERPFSATWRGWLSVVDAGPHVFATSSDDGSWIYIDDTLVVDNGGEHAAQERHGRIVLTAGLHRIRIDYFQRSGPTALSVRWAPGDGELAPLPARVLFPTRLASWLYPRVSPVRDVLPDLRLGYVLATIASCAMVVAVAMWGWRAVRSHTGAHAGEPAVNRWLWRLLGLAAGLAVWQVWYGIPIGWDGWEGDELRARDVIPGLEMAFSGGWFDLYAPLYFYVLGVLSLPFKLASVVGTVDLWSDETTLTLSALYRATAVLSGLATVYLTYRCGAEAFGHRGAGLWAGVVVAVMPNFVYLTKLAKPDVPYLVPFLVSMLYYLRCLREPRPAWYTAFAAAGMTAICIKDQAYALYILPAAHLVWLRWRRLSGAPAARLAAVVRDPALARAGLAAVAIFVVSHNLLFNLRGFLEHLSLMITGGRAYRVYQPTLMGQALLLRDSLAQVPWMFGWPAAMLVAAGIAMSWRRRREATVALLLPVVSYYVFCIAVIGYHYDRFFMAPAMLLAVFAGQAFARLVAHPASWPRTLALCIAAFSLIRGASVNLLMTRDSRYAAEKWLRAHVAATATVGHFEPLAYLPRPGPLRFQALEPAWEAVAAAAPEFLVVNTEFARRESTLGFYGPLFVGTHPDYRPVARFKSSPGPAALLANDRVFWNGVEDAFTNLDKINPDIQVYARRDVAVP